MSEPTEASIRALKPKWARDELIRQGSELTALRAEVARLRQRAEDPGGAFTALDEELRARDATIAERDQQVTSLQARVDEKDEEIRKLKEDLEGKDGEIEEVHAEYARGDDEATWRDGIAGLWEQIGEGRLRKFLATGEQLEDKQAAGRALRAASLVRAGTAANRF